jgi:ppGpp synthetase/RelA/SpoT-type nucleotidyltranferase
MDDKMTSLTFAEIENAQFAYRQARRPIQREILHFLLTNSQIIDPFWALNRMFVRLKSAESIVEKINRKHLAVQTMADLQRLVRDVLGLRIITGTLAELEAVDGFLQNSFGVVSRKDFVSQPNEFGYQSVEYELLYRPVQGGEAVPFEVQLRTLFQHQWSVNSFFLFHKKSPEVARPYQPTLQTLSQTLAQVETLSNQISAGTIHAPRQAETQALQIEKLPIQAFINLMVINPGEIFVEHVRLPISGDDQADHAMIVSEKTRLYQVYPGAAVVECACMNPATYALNESHVIFLPQYFEKIQW